MTTRTFCLMTIMELGELARTKALVERWFYMEFPKETPQALIDGRPDYHVFSDSAREEKWFNDTLFFSDGTAVSNTLLTA